MAGAVLLTGGDAGDRAANNFGAMTDNRADALDAQANATTSEQAADGSENRADHVRDMGETKAEEADDDVARVEGRVATAM